jgi:flagellar hook-associated protein 3 FlgL
VRITTAYRTELALRHFQGNLARLSELETQVATGKRFTRMSEDPAAGAHVLRLDRAARGLDQYARNAAAAQVRLGAEQAVTSQVDDLMRQARDFALSFARGDPPYNPTQAAERQIAADQLTRLLDDAVAMGNTKIGNEFILGGSVATTPPFDPTPGATLGTYQGDSRPRTIEVADGVFVAPNHSGDQYLAPVLAALRSLRDAVDPANLQTEAQVQIEVQNLFQASQTLQVSLAETGSTGNRILSAERNNGAIKRDLANVRGNLVDVPIEEAITRMLSLQTTIEASYAATSRMLSLSLSDYLR